MSLTKSDPNDKVEANAFVVYCPKVPRGVQGFSAPIGVWFPDDSADKITGKALEGLRLAAEGAGNFKGYEVFPAANGSLRIRAEVVAKSPDAFRRATTHLSSLIWRHLRLRAQHQQLMNQAMVVKLLAA